MTGTGFKKDACEIMEESYIKRGGKVEVYEIQLAGKEETNYVSLNLVTGAFGYAVKIMEETKEVHLTAGRKQVVLADKSQSGILNGYEISLEKPIYIQDGDVQVPVSFFSDILGFRVQIDQQNMTASITDEVTEFNRADCLIYFHENLMKQTKADMESGDAFCLKAYHEIKREADNFMKQPMDSVVNKTMVPPSGDMHDYLTIAPYFWPDPDSETGLPWKPKDGQINPKSRGADTDFVRTSEMFNGLETLCLCYYYSDDTSYLNKCLECIRVWFLDEKTRMNPYIKYGQSVPGGIEGRPLGVIEWTSIVNVITALQLLERNHMIRQEELDAMSDWLTAYASWLQRSNLGIEEDEQRNNHGSNYDYQLAGILIYLNRMEEAIERLESVKTRRIDDYIQPDGSQPFELRRTKSINYTCMNLRVLTKVAYLAKKFLDIDLWNYESEDGRSLKKAYAFLKPYILNEKKWEWKQIQETVDIKLENTMRPLFINAKVLFGDEFLDFPDSFPVSIPYFDVLRFHMKCKKNNDEIVWKSYQI